MSEITQFCPICSKPVPVSERYPMYVCMDCAARAVSRDGRALSFFNESLSGGFAAQITDTGETYSSHECYINGIQCYADEAHFGGIVIQPV